MAPLKPSFTPFGRSFFAAAFSLVLFSHATAQAQVSATYNTVTDIPVTAAGYTASGAVNFTLNFAPPVGTKLKVVENTGLGFISGAFSNLAHGQEVTLTHASRNYEFVADYYGGNGNDLELVWKRTRLIGWGWGGKQLGVDPVSTLNINLPRFVDTTGGQLSGRTILQVAPGFYSTHALCSDGRILSWGEGGFGSLGNGSTTSLDFPQAIPQTGALAGKTVAVISAGLAHVMALCSDGSLVVWGRNNYGQVGDGTTVNKPSPVLINGGALAGKTVVAISAGEDHSLALCSDGTLAAWGFGANGRLGTGNTTTQSSPTQVVVTGALVGKTIVSIGGGGGFSAVLCSDGTVVTWGNDQYGQLGADGSHSLVPLQVSTGAGSALQGKLVKAIAVGTTQVLAQCTDGTLVGWGIFGGDGAADGTRNYTPVAVNMSGVLSGKTVRTIQSGTNHHMVFCTDGSIVGWGDGNGGTLGNGVNSVQTMPVLTNTSMLASDDRVMGLGKNAASFNNFAVVGFSGLPDIAVEVTGGAGINSGATLPFGVEELTFSKPIGLTLQNTGSGPLTVSNIALSGVDAADFSVSGITLPQNLAPGARVNFVVSFAPGSAGAKNATLTFTNTDLDEDTFTVALTGTGQALDTTPLNATYTTGAEVPVTAATYTAEGRQLNLTFNFQPAVGSKLTVINNTGLGFIRGAFANLRQGQPVTISFGGQDYHFVANYFGGTGNDLELVWATNRLAAWGYGGSQLGVNPPTDSNVNTPRAVGQAGGPLEGKAILSVSAGYWHSVALLADGTLLSWGLNHNGMLGNGTNTTGSFPAPVLQSGVLAGKRVAAISCGSFHTLALTSDGLIAAWGGNNNGQLGDGTTDNRNAPVLVNTLGALAGKKVVGISAGYFQSMALCSDGTLVSWGGGPLGDGTNNNSNVPVVVTVAGSALVGRTPIQVSAGSSHSMVLCSDGVAVGWGSNSYGQLGISPSANPVYLAREVFAGAGSALQGKTIKSISAGSAETTALCTDGTLVSWGLYTGDGTSNQRGTPVLVSTATALSGKTVVAHTARYNNKTALCSDGSLVGWGYNDEGGVGDGTFSERLSPVAVDSSVLLANEKFSALAQASGAGHGLAVIASPQTVEIVVEQPADTGLTDGSATVAYGSVLVNTSASKTFTIKNAGNTYLTGLTIAIDGPDADDFDVTTVPVSPVIAGASTTFVLQFNPTTLGAKTAALHISSNDSDENPFDIALTATSFGIPEIDVQEEVGTSFASGGTTDFGNAVVGTSKVKTFTVLNTGSAPITGLTTNFSAGDFNMNAPLGSLTIAPGGSTTFSVRFQPGGGGAATGTLELGSNDADESPYVINFTGNGIPVSAAEIAVIHDAEDDVELADNVGTVAFGPTEIGVGQIFTFIIRNTGTANLTGLSLSKTGANAADFTLSALSTTTLGFEGFTTFTVNFLPSALGARTATVRIASNDANENPFDIVFTGTGTTPEIDVQGPSAVALADGSGTLNYGTGLPVGTPVDRIFNIRNLGTATLNLVGAPVIDGANAADFQSLGYGAATVAPGASTTLTVRFNPSNFGVRNAALHLVNSDSNENPYDIKLTGTAVGPEISIEQPAATVLVDGVSSVNFGPALQATNVSRTFTIKNPGGAVLNSIAASVIGADVGNFTVTTAPPATLASKGTTTFIVRFTPNALRVFNATLRVASSDYDENPFDIAITGEGVETLNPSFDQHPNSEIVALGQPVSFFSVIDSPTAATSQWRKGNSSTFANITGATAATYTIPAVKLTDAAVLYRNRATNAAGSTDSNTAALTVVDRTPKSFNLAVGAKATFTVSAATTTGATLTYLWLKDGDPLPVNARYVVGPANQLVINSLETDDAAIYTCEVTGPGGTLAGGNNVLTVFDEAPLITPNPLVMTPGIVSGDYSFFIPLDPTKGTATTFTATPLPAGLKLNATTGEIYGKPTAPKVSPPYSFTVTAKNSINTSTATATLVVQPLTSGADGDYVGIIQRGVVNDGLGGRIDLKITPTGSYSGKITLGTKSHSFPSGVTVTATAGNSNVTGAATIIRAPLPALNVTFTINTITKRITTGIVSSAGIGSSSLSGWKNAWSATNQSTQYDGYYTFSLDVPLPLAGDDDIPQGIGYGSFKVPLKGESITLAGQTADGDKFTSSTFLGPDGDLALFDDLPSKGSFVGILDIVPGTGPGFDDNGLTGSPTWSRPENTAANASTYKDGFAAFSTVITGGSYVPPAATAIVLGKSTPAVANNAGIAFFDAGIGGPPSRADRHISLIPGSSVTIAASGLTQTTLKIATATGVFSGGFTLSDAHPITPGAKPIVRKPTFQGIIVRTPGGGQAGHGFFLMQQLPEPVFPQPAVLPVLSGGVIVE